MFDPTTWLDRLAALPDDLDAVDAFAVDFETALNEPGALTRAALHVLMHGDESLAGGVVQFPGRRLFGYRPILEARTFEVKKGRGSVERYRVDLQVREFTLRHPGDWYDVRWADAENEVRLRCAPALPLLVTNLAALNLATEII